MDKTTGSALFDDVSAGVEEDNRPAVPVLHVEVACESGEPDTTESPLQLSIVLEVAVLTDTHERAASPTLHPAACSRKLADDTAIAAHCCCG